MFTVKTLMEKYLPNKKGVSSLECTHGELRASLLSKVYHKLWTISVNKRRRVHLRAGAF